MANIFFQMSALLYLSATAVIYLLKKKQKTIENSVFKSLIAFEAVTLIFDVAGIICGTTFNIPILNAILGKLYLCGISSWMIIYTYYLHVITHPENKERIIIDNSDLSQQFLASMKKMMLFNLVILIITFCLPITTSVTNGIYTFYGPAEIFTYIMAGACLLGWMALIFKNFKTTKKQRINLIVASIFVAIVALIIQGVRSDITLVSSIGAFITTLAYFMLENPDLHYIEELNIATQQAESANHAKSDFLSSMSHEIRTPLNAIVGFSQALAKEDISGSAKEEVKEILNASTNLLETVNGILDISKIEANKIELVSVDYSTKKMINEIINTANSRIGSKTIDFKIEIDEALPPVLLGDNVRIKQIILNLLTNSIKYTKDGYVRFAIDAQCSQNKCLLTIIVEDTGIGMTKADIDMLFVKFQRFEMDKNINIAGTGLGMAIVKGLVELMNGEINVQSEYGKGSTFTIILEQDISTKKVEEVASKEELEKIEPFNATGQRVLVVDDNKINLKVAEKLLSDYKLSIDLVDTGRECINKIISGEKYDLILLDIMMPKMKGPEVLKNLKAQVGFNIPVVALTADVISGMEERYIEQGFDDCLPKPIVEEELFYLLKKYLKEVTEEGLLEHNYTSIETPVEVVSSIVKEVVEPIPEEEIELPKLSDLPVLKEEVKEEQVPSTIPETKEEVELPVIKENTEVVETTPIIDSTPKIEEPKVTDVPVTEEQTSIITPKVNQNNDRVELIEQLKQRKNSPEEYGRLASLVKAIAEKENLTKLAEMAYEHELAGKAHYQDFITENYDTLVNEIINHIDVIKKEINKE